MIIRFGHELKGTGGEKSAINLESISYVSLLAPGQNYRSNCQTVVQNLKPKMVPFICPAEWGIHRMRGCGSSLQIKISIKHV